MHVDEITLTGGLVEDVTDEIVQLEEVGVFRHRRIRFPIQGNSAEPLTGPVAVEVAVDEADMLGEGGLVAPQRHEGALDPVPFDGQRVEHP